MANLLGDFISWVLGVDLDQDSGGGLAVTLKGEDLPLPVVYGQQRVKPIRVYAETRDVSDGLPNELIYMAMPLCHGEVDSIGEMHINGEPLAESKFNNTRNREWLILDEVYTGTDTQAADSTFVSETQDWTSSHQGRGVAYAALKMVMPDWGEKNPFLGGMPEFSWLVRGQKVYDPRLDSTQTAISGSGSHRSNDQSTWEWSDNPALCIMDYLTNSRYGKGLAYSRIDITSFAAAADDFETSQSVETGVTTSQGVPAAADSYSNGGATDHYYVDFSGNVTESFRPRRGMTQNAVDFTTRFAKYDKADDVTRVIYDITSSTPTQMNAVNSVTVSSFDGQFSTNATIDTDQKILDNIKTLLAGCRAYMPYYDGRYHLYLENTSTSQMAFNTSNMIGGISINLPKKDGKLNQVRATFSDPKNDYQKSEIVWPEVGSAEETLFLVEDNNETLVKEVEFSTIASEYQAYNMAKAVCLHSRYSTRVSFKAFPEAAKLSVNDVIDIIHPTPGWSAEGEDWGSVADAVDESEDWGLVSDAATTFADWGYVDESDGTGVHFIIEAISINYDGTVNIDARQYISSIYDYDATQAKANRLRTDLPDSYEVVAPTSLSLSDDSVLLGDGSLNPVLGISWTASTDRFVRDYEIQWKKDSESNYHSIFTPNVNASIVVEAIDTYDVRVRALNGIGSTSDWITGSQLVDDDTTAPSAPTGVSVTNLVMGSRIAWTNDSAADLDAVEIHVRDTNTTPTDDTYLVHTAKARPSTAGEFVYAVADLQIGKTNYVFLKSVDYSGNKSSFTSSVTIQATRLSSGYNVDNATQITQTLTGGSLGETLYSVLSGDDGLYVFFAGEGPSPSTTNYIQQNKLDTLYDLSSTSSVGSFNHASIGDTRDMAINPAGTKLFAADVDNNKVHEISMSAWDISTASYVDALSLGYSPEGIAFNGDGTEIIISDGSSTITHYDLSTAYDISTASASGDTFSTQAAPDGVQWSEDGLLLIVAEAGNAAFYQCSTAYDITTATFTSQSSGNFQNPLYGTGQKTSTSVTFGDRGFSFDRNGTRCYLGASLSGPSRDQVVCYQTSYG